MKGSSKVIMGATMAIVIVLAIVLILVLVLLAELYCSLFLRQRKNKPEKPDTNPENPVSQSPQPQEQLVPSPLSSFYAQGVLEAPRSFLFPKLPSRRENRAETDDIERPKHGKLHQFLRVQSPQQIGFASSLSPSPSFINPATKKPHQNPNENPEIIPEDGNEENLMYISNPIYDNEVARVATPFETPDSSPSQLERSGSSGDDEEKRESENKENTSTSPSSLPLSPMKELPAKAASVSLRDARSLGPSASESNSHIGRSSSSSDSPRTSPSW